MAGGTTAGGAPRRGASRIAPDLRLQLRVFIVVLLAMVLLVVLHLLRDHVNPLWALAGFAAGIAIGFVATRIKVLRWDADEAVVVGAMDGVGVMVLVVYLASVLLKSTLIDSWLHDAARTAVVALALTAGTMAGRIYFTLRSIQRILSQAVLADDRHTGRPR